MPSKEKLLSVNLIKQLWNFGIVGILAFIVELVCLNVLIKQILPFIISGREEDFYTLVATPIAFTISVIFNYILSMKFVFIKRQDAKGGTVFAIFIVLNVIALGLNQLFMWIFVNTLPMLNYNISKIITTGLVMVYNFISRKIFIEDHSNK